MKPFCARYFAGIALCLLLTACSESHSNTDRTTAATVAQTTPDSEQPQPAPHAGEPTGAAGLPATDAPQSLQAYQNSLARRCDSDADCVVKNVGSCCGYTPQCVHKAVQTFPEQVKALCEKEGRSSICGFQEPAGCSCVNNQCRNSSADAL